MYGPPVEITPSGDLLIWGGLAFLLLVGLLASLGPRMMGRRRPPRST